MYFKIASVRVVSYSVGEGTFPEEKQLNQNAAPRYGSIALEGRLTKTCVNNLQSFLSPHNANKYGVKVEINLKFQTSLDETAHKSQYIGEIHIEGGDVVIDVLLDASMFLPVVAMKKDLLSVYAGIRLTTQVGNKDDYDIAAAKIERIDLSAASPSLVWSTITTIMGIMGFASR